MWHIAMCQQWRTNCVLYATETYELCAKETDELHMRQPRTNDVQQRHTKYVRMIILCKRDWWITCAIVTHLCCAILTCKGDWWITYATATHQQCATETFEFWAKKELCAKETDESHLQQRYTNVVQQRRTKYTNTRHATEKSICDTFPAFSNITQAFSTYQFRPHEI